MKQFFDDGEIREGEFNKKCNQINGFMWYLQDDGTFDKIKVETVKIDKQPRNEESSKDEDDEEEVYQLISNEKSYC